VTFNYLNSFEWFRQRVYKLEDTGHNVSDRQKALEKSFEWGERIPIGVFYKDERPTFRDNLPQVKGVPLTKLPIEDLDISRVIESMK
jgi:2-oxoglutarate ferredoxin oxidoreductase subunit beta